MPDEKPADKPEQSTKPAKPKQPAKPKAGRPKGTKNGAALARKSGEKVPRAKRKSPWFGKKLQMIRRVKSVTQAGLETVLLDNYGIRLHPLTISRIERGVTTANTDEAWAICDHFGVPMRWMCNPNTKDTDIEDFVAATSEYKRAQQIIDEIGPHEAVARLLKIPSPKLPAASGDGGSAQA